MNIPPLSKTRLALIASLSNVKMRRRHGLFVVEGSKGVADTLSSFSLHTLIIRESMAGIAFNQLERAVSPDKVAIADDRQMSKISNQKTLPDMMAVYEIPAFAEMPEVDYGKLYVMLDGVQDPGNLGTIVRTCHWFGVNTIFASRDSADLYNPKTVQATMGSLGHVQVVYCDLHEVIETHPDMPVFGTLLDGSDIYKAPLSSAGFIIFGNEGNGISKALRPMVNSPLLIPAASDDHGESLNVGVSVGVVLSQFRSR